MIPVNIRDPETSTPFVPLNVPCDNEGFCQAFTVNEPNEIAEFFWKYGFVVVRDVLSQEDVQQTYKEIFEVARVDPNKPESWINVNWDKVYGSSYNAKKGFLGNNIALTPAAWKNRENENIYKAYGAILKQKDLWIKLDRFGFMRPTRQLISGNTTVDRVDWETSRNWVHWDQNPWLEPNFCRIQAIIAITDSTNTTGGFHCIPGFTHHFKTWAKKNIESKNFSCLVNFPDDDDIKKHTTRIFMRKGSILMWDSRTPHGNYPNESNGFRIVQYTGMYPYPHKDIDAQEILGQRKREMKNLFKYSIFPINLTPLGKKICGLEDYGEDEKSDTTIIDANATFNRDQCGY
jgi:ectoine hydroxylase-related dioxygenase (phytanoyl-CoA dioxygenase family)